METREQKKAHIDEFNEKFSRAEAMFVTNYRGVDSNDMTELRKSLREAGVEYKIMKNTLARLAVKETPYEGLADSFTGTTAVAISYKDCTLAAKSLVAFIKEQPKLEIKTAAIGSKVLAFADVENLAKLPGREELLGKLLGGLNAIPGSLVCTLAAVPRKLLYCLNAVKEAKEKAA